MSAAKQRATVIEWISSLLPYLSLSVNASDEELRAYLIDGTILCQLLNKLKPGSIPEVVVIYRILQLLEAKGGFVFII